MSENNSNSNKHGVINWISTILGIVLGLIALIGWFKESGRSIANSESIAAQTQRQWELRQADQVIIANLRNEISALKSDVEWMKKGHKVVDFDKQ